MDSPFRRKIFVIRWIIQGRDLFLERERGGGGQRDRERGCDLVWFFPLFSFENVSYVITL